VNNLCAFLLVVLWSEKKNRTAIISSTEERNLCRRPKFSGPKSELNGS
jgi:hypothetical protein